jgi:hypothetical protein
MFVPVVFSRYALAARSTRAVQHFAPGFGVFESDNRIFLQIVVKLYRFRLGPHDAGAL